MLRRTRSGGVILPALTAMIFTRARSLRSMRRTGKLAWYYQTTPGDNLDQDADAPFVQATLKIGGHARNVLMQASKNGFFYVLDRKTGELISGKPYTYVNWATGLDARGRPVLTKTANYREQPQLIYPNYNGGHSWIPMSYSAQTHLVYIPVIDAPMVWVDLYNKPIQYVEGNVRGRRVSHGQDVRSAGSRVFIREAACVQGRAGAASYHS